MIILILRYYIRRNFLLFMHRIRLYSISLFTIFILTSLNPKIEWISLLDKNLSNWEMYLSFSHKNNFKGEHPKDELGNFLKPIGYNKNIKNVFSVAIQDNQPMLRVSGEIYGCIFTKKEYEKYHLRLQVKFGKKKWVPRLNEDMDSGILYNSLGPCGIDYWKSWMLSQELQIIEHSIGDYWCIGSSQINIKSKKNNQSFMYDSLSNKDSFGYKTINGNFCKASNHSENEIEEWNTVELICFGDKSIHIVNGQVVMSLSDSRYMEGNKVLPLIKGKIQIQSEAAEVFYKNIEIKFINNIPEQYSHLF